METLKFKSNEIVNLTNDECDYGEIVFTENDGTEYSFTIKNVNVIYGHDDSLPYIGEMCVNGKALCHCYNDGWGGETTLTPIPAKEDLFNKLSEMVQSARWYSVTYQEKPLIIKFSIDFIADTLAISALSNKRKSA